MVNHIFLSIFPLVGLIAPHQAPCEQFSTKERVRSLKRERTLLVLYNHSTGIVMVQNLLIVIACIRHPFCAVLAHTDSVSITVYPGKHPAGVRRIVRKAFEIGRVESPAVFVKLLCRIRLTTKSNRL